MPASALIGRKNPANDEMDVILVERDGEPDRLGALLQEYYRDPATVDALFRQGDLLELGATVAECTPHPNADNLEYRIPLSATDYDIAIAALARSMRCGFIYGFQGERGWMVSAASPLPAYLPVADAVETTARMHDGEWELQNRHRRPRNSTRPRRRAGG